MHFNIPLVGFVLIRVTIELVARYHMGIGGSQNRGLVRGFFSLEKILIIMSRRARRNLLHFKQLSNVIKINQILKKTSSRQKIS